MSNTTTRRMLEETVLVSPAVVVHIGAGKHGTQNERVKRLLVEHTCKVGMSLLEEGESSQNAVTAIGKILEDSPLTNAGIGSSWNEDGRVECDASIMSSASMQCAGVGAVRTVPNPLVLASKLLDEINGPHDAYGRMRPSLLAGEGAERFARRHGIPEHDLKTKAAEHEFHNESQKIKHGNGNENEDTKEDVIADTIGVICLDEQGQVTVGASSGGGVLKAPGRVGPAALPHCGISISKSASTTCATCASGCGEDIIATQAASRVARQFGIGYDEMHVYPEFFREINSSVNLQSPSYFGLVSLVYDHNAKHTTVSWAHQTDCMIIGYASRKKAPKSVVSRANQLRTMQFGAAAL